MVSVWTDRRFRVAAIDPEGKAFTRMERLVLESARKDPGAKASAHSSEQTILLDTPSDYFKARVGEELRVCICSPNGNKMPKTDPEYDCLAMRGTVFHVVAHTDKAKNEDKEQTAPTRARPAGAPSGLPEGQHSTEGQRMLAGKQHMFAAFGGMLMCWTTTGLLPTRLATDSELLVVLERTSDHTRMDDV